MISIKLNPFFFAVLIFNSLIGAHITYAESTTETADGKTLSVPIQGNLSERLAKVGLHPSVTQKIEPPEGFKMPEIPQAIKNEHLSPAGQVRMNQSDRNRGEGKQTETEHNLEKDTLFRDANLKF